MKNRFGHRYIRHRTFLDYARSLDLFTDHPSGGLFEFLECHGLLSPVARIRFPPEVVRRWHKERYPAADVPDPMEGDTPRLAAATALYEEVYNSLWDHPEIYGERPHPLDALEPEHIPFVQTDFDPAQFVPWKEFRTVVQIENGREIGDAGQSVRTCYHYWQVFPLASLLRSGVSILYDLYDQALSHELWTLRLSDSSRERLWVTMNIEARHELRKINEHAALFEAVAWFEAYCRNALQVHSRNVDRTSGVLPYKHARAYRRRCQDIARQTLQRFSLQPARILEFIRFQCELWCTAKDRSPAKLADEYARNIASTIKLYREVTKVKTGRIIELVGFVGGHRKPILKEIFPDWLDEQRDLAERSLNHWILPAMTGLPAPFAATDADATAFCTWLEEQGLFQLYWHFKRLSDLGHGDGPVARTAIATEVVSYANTVELMANAIIAERGASPRGDALAVKIRKIVEPTAPSLVPLLIRFKMLTRTDGSTLGQRLAQIDRIRRGGAHAPVLRALLKLIVIRNEGSHLGLAGLDRQAVYSLLQTLLEASILLWKVR